MKYERSDRALASDDVARDLVGFSLIVLPIAAMELAV